MPQNCRAVCERRREIHDEARVAEQQFTNDMMKLVTCKKVFVAFMVKKVCSETRAAFRFGKLVSR